MFPLSLRRSACRLFPQVYNRVGYMTPPRNPSSRSYSPGLPPRPVPRPTSRSRYDHRPDDGTLRSHRCNLSHCPLCQGPAAFAQGQASQ